MTSRSASTTKGKGGPLIPDAVLQEIHARADCSALASTLGLRRGKDGRWFCPGCQSSGGKTPDLSTPRKRPDRWKCFKCNESGDALALVALAQGRTLPRDFVEVAHWLADHLGIEVPEQGTTPRPTPRPTPPPPAAPPEDPEVPTPEEVGAAWHALDARQSEPDARQSAAGNATRWLDGRGVPARLVGSGFATLDTRAVLDLATAPAAHWLRRHVDAALVVPLRSARTGAVVALQARAFDPGEHGKRRPVGRKADKDGAPRSYGRPDHLVGAALVVLVEGMVDTLAAEALTAYAPGVVVVGAIDIGVMPRLAAWMVDLQVRAPVVVAYHLDKKRPGNEQGDGQKAAVDVVKRLGTRARLFPWPTYRRRLFDVGVDTSGPRPGGFDLTDTLAAAREARVPFDTVAAVFCDVVGAKHTPPPARVDDAGDSNP